VRLSFPCASWFGEDDLVRKKTRTSWSDALTQVFIFTFHKPRGAFIWNPVFLAPGLVSSWRQVFSLYRCALHLVHRPGCTPFIGSSLAVWKHRKSISRVITREKKQGTKDSSGSGRFVDCLYFQIMNICLVHNVVEACKLVVEACKLVVL
jgi:hypothetical protein